MNRNYSSLKAYKLGLSPDSSTWYMANMMTLSSHQHPQVEVFLPDRGVPNSNSILGSSLDNCTTLRTFSMAMEFAFPQVG